MMNLDPKPHFKMLNRSPRLGELGVVRKRRVKSAVQNGARDTTFRKLVIYRPGLHLSCVFVSEFCVHREDLVAVERRHPSSVYKARCDLLNLRARQGFYRELDLRTARKETPE